MRCTSCLGAVQRHARAARSIGRLARLDHNWWTSNRSNIRARASRCTRAKSSRIPKAKSNCLARIARNSNTRLFDRLELHCFGCIDDCSWLAIEVHYPTPRVHPICTVHHVQCGDAARVPPELRTGHPLDHDVRRPQSGASAVHNLRWS